MTKYFVVQKIVTVFYIKIPFQCFQFYKKKKKALLFQRYMGSKLGSHAPFINLGGTVIPESLVLLTKKMRIDTVGSK